MAAPGTNPAFRALGVGIMLTAVWGAYALLTKPLLHVERKPAAAPKEQFTTEKSPVFSDRAVQWFPQDPWVREAKGRFRDGGRMLYFEQHQLMSENRSVLVKPIALLWQEDTTNNEVPITATADSAQLDTAGKFSFGEGTFGPITSGLLAGDVRITGPDGLRIEGRNFYISEGSMKIWTGLPVKFSWGTHSGSAEAGAEIELLSEADSKEPGLMSVSDVRRIRLRGRVVCNLAFVDEDKEREPILMTVNAANGFEFFVPTREATFLGFADRRPQRDNQILIERPMPDGGKDMLYCSRLVLQLQPKIRQGTTSRSSRMELSSITAEGKPAYYSSRKNDLEVIRAQMRLLTYDITAKTLEMRDGTEASTGLPIPVQVHQGGRQLTTGRVVVSLDDDNQVLGIECRTPGEITESEIIPAGEDPEVRPFNTSWNELLQIVQGHEPKVILAGNAKITQEATDLRLGGDLVEMILKKDTNPDAEGSDTSFDSDDTTDINLGNLKPQRLTVTGNVELGAKEITGRAREKLVVTFQERPTGDPSSVGTIHSVSQSEQASNSESGVSDSEDDPAKMPARLNGTTTLLSDTIEATASVPESGHAEFRNVWLKGKVQVTHKSDRKEQSFTAEGNSLFARDGFNGDRDISLYGDPASIVRSSNDRIEGEKIDLADAIQMGDAKRSVFVQGSGRIRFVVSVGLDGKPQEKPSFLDIYWGDSMNFSGQTAHFAGSIRVVMKNDVDQDVRLHCDGLTVHFTDNLLLEKAGSKEEYQVADPSGQTSPVGQIERIECRNQVKVDIDMKKQGEVVAHHHAEFTDLVFNHVTGDFHATGPGVVESTFPDEGRGARLTSSQRAVARANVSAKADVASFVYVQAKFIGELKGNQQSGFVQLKQHVRGVFGPVRALTDRLVIDELSLDELPEYTGSLGCENLSISQIPAVSEGSPSFSLVAECNASESNSGTRSPCKLESKLLSGDADKITYDHSKQQFLLKAEDGRQATVLHRSNEGKRGRFVGRQFAYYVDSNELNATQITGVQASE